MTLLHLRNQAARYGVCYKVSTPWPEILHTAPWLGAGTEAEPAAATKHLAVWRGAPRAWAVTLLLPAAKCEIMVVEAAWEP
jgi:hypothetical protein